MPLVVWGPTGCGKTVGLRDLIRHMHRDAVVLDAVAADDQHQLLLWIRRARSTRSVEKGAPRRVVVLDDMEGLTPETRKAIFVHCETTAKDATLTPFVLVCNQLRDPMWKPLLSLTNVRIRAPNEHECYEWFTRHHMWDLPQSRGGGCTQTFPHHWVQAVNGTGGDLRRMALSLTLRAHIKIGGAGAHVESGGRCDAVRDAFASNVFDATRGLLRRTRTVEQWSHDVELRDVDLVQHHATSFAPTLERLDACLDALSAVAAHRPERFELQSQHEPYYVYAAGLAASVTMGAIRDVGALVPPPRPRKKTDPGAPDTWSAQEALNRTLA